MLYATGEGQTNPPGVDSKPADVPYPQPRLRLRVLIGGKEAEVLYAGGAPGLVAGVMQVNARIPPDIGRGAIPVLLNIEGAESQAGVTIAVSGN